MSFQPDLITADQLCAQLSKVNSLKHQSASLPPACYSDEVIRKKEADAIFLRGWVGVGRSDRWPSAGDYSALDIAGVPVLIVRDKSGSLKGYANSCRHRGSQLLKGSGNCRKIRCPFHCWTYNLDGKLSFAPRMEKAIDFDHKDYGLVEFRVQCQDGFAFICLDQSTLELSNWLGDFCAIHAPWKLEQLVSTRVREFEVNCNWKTFIEVFNEYYHLPFVHPDSINWLYPEPDDADSVAGNFTTQFGETSGNAALMADTQDYALPAAKHLEGRTKKGTRYSWIYPNMTFAISPDSMWMYQAYPVTADKSFIVQTICFPADTVQLEDFETRVKHYYDRYDAALNEDIPFLEQQQVGLSSRFAKPGRFSALEPSVANFANWYAQQLNAAISEA